MRINTTVPDDLGAKAKAYNLNISGILQDALERKINMLETMKDSDLVTLDLEERQVAFKGSFVASTQEHRWQYFVTAKGQVVTYDNEMLIMGVQTADAFEDDDRADSGVKALVLEELGREYVEVLDI